MGGEERGWDGMGWDGGSIPKIHGRKSQGDESPQNWQWGDANTSCPPQIFVMFQNFKR
jgi:hypothetical protein